MSNNKLMKSLVNFKVINIILLLLWIIALLSAMFIGNYMFESYLDTKTFLKENKDLLSVFFMLLAASIASASVMKSIEANRELKRYEIARVEKSQLLFMIYICSQIKNNHTIEYRRSLKKTVALTQIQIRHEINEAIKLWEKLSEDKYFIYFGEKGLSCILEVNKRIYFIRNQIENSLNIDEFIFNTIRDENEVININMDELLKILNERKMLTDTKCD